MTTTGRICCMRPIAASAPAVAGCGVRDIQYQSGSDVGRSPAGEQREDIHAQPCAARASRVCSSEIVAQAHDRPRTHAFHAARRPQSRICTSRVRAPHPSRRAWPVSKRCAWALSDAALTVGAQPDPWTVSRAPEGGSRSRDPGAQCGNAGTPSALVRRAAWTSRDPAWPGPPASPRPGSCARGTRPGSRIARRRRAAA